jgi:hypothetical protein
MAVSLPRMTKGIVKRIGHAGMAFTPPHEKDGREGCRVWHGRVRLLVRDRDHTVNRKINRMPMRRPTPILPVMSLVEVIETMRIYRVGEHIGDRTTFTMRPCRAPLHTILEVGLIGGGLVALQAKCLWRTMGCSFWMNAQSSNTTA